MKLRPRISGSSIGLVCALAAILLFLAFLQVRWSNQVSQAQRDRMRGNLYIAATLFRRNVHLEMFRICWTFQSAPTGPIAKILQAYADHYDDWMGASAHPDLVSGLYAWSGSRGKGVQLFRFDPASTRFVKVAWPSQLEALRGRLTSRSAHASQPQRADEESWIIDGQIPALYHRWRSAVPGKIAPGATQGHAQGGVIIELDMNFIKRTLLPMLADRYFRGPKGFTYRVTIVRGSHPAQVIYQSVPGPAITNPPTGDMVVDLLFGGSHRAGPLLNEYRATASSGTSQDALLPDWPEVANSPPLEEQRRPFALIVPASESANWKLIVRHRAGSVEAAVLQLRRRNLAVSFSVLALLAISMALILISARRAHRLAKLQIDFVAGVSHELRTPLAVICSAAENLADGVAAGKEQVKDYGALVLNQGRRLSQMVDQILVFATTRAGYPSYHLGPVPVSEVLEAVVNATMLEPAGIAAEKKIEPDLPRVMADRSALERCLQNLISNAVKYGGEGHWIGIRAGTARHGEKLGVEVTVEDHGSGIPAEDLPHIFEPFYRGRTSRAVHGTGLGLSLAREMAEAMGGELSVKSSPGCGSRFTLWLPALADEELSLQLPHHSIDG